MMAYLNIWMFEAKTSRKILIVVLSIVLAVFFVWYGSMEPAPDKGDYPGQEDLIKDYEKYIDEKAEVGGKVIETDPLVIETEYGDRTMDLTIVDAQESPSKNDRVTVYGTVRENHTIEAENMVVRPRWRWFYMYGISGIAAVWVGLRMIEQWRWNGKRFALEVREEPLKLKDLLKKSSSGDTHG